MSAPRPVPTTLAAVPAPQSVTVSAAPATIAPLGYVVDAAGQTFRWTLESGRPTLAAFAKDSDGNTFWLAITDEQLAETATGPLNLTALVDLPFEVQAHEAKTLPAAEVAADERLSHLIDQWRALKAEVDKKTKQIEDLNKSIKAQAAASAPGRAAVITSASGQTVAIEAAVGRWFNGKALKSAYPSMYEQFRQPGIRWNLTPVDTAGPDAAA